MSTTMILHALVMNNSIVDLAHFDASQSPPWFDASTLPDAELLVFYQANMGITLNAACQRYIYGGFTSSALGMGAYAYPSDEISQRNLASAGAAAASAGASWARLFWCGDANGVWEMRLHTAPQMQQVNSDFDAFVAAAQYKLASLRNQLAAATTSAEATAIVWD